MRNSIAADAKPMVMFKPFMDLYVNIRETETSEIAILVYIQHPNFAHKTTYVSTDSRQKNKGTDKITSFNVRSLLSYLIIQKYFRQYIIWDLTTATLNNLLDFFLNFCYLPNPPLKNLMVRPLCTAGHKLLLYIIYQMICQKLQQKLTTRTGLSLTASLNMEGRTKC